MLFGNEKITTLKLPATATQWKLTEVGEYSSAPLGKNEKLTDPNNYQTAPVGWKDGQSNGKLSQGIFFEKFKTGTSNEAATDFASIDWQLVASILNMFGYVKDGDKDKNLLPWSEGKWDAPLSGNISQQDIWENVSQRNSGSASGRNKFPITSSTKSATLTVNNLIWKYTATPGSSITLSATSSSNKAPNLYRAGYTGNQYAYFQVQKTKYLRC